VCRVGKTNAQGVTLIQADVYIWIVGSVGAFIHAKEQQKGFPYAIWLALVWPAVLVYEALPNE